jgi:diacylglycerol kinase (ATP)
LNGPIRRVVAVGGDGTVNLAAECLLAAGRGAPGDVSLGIVPAGTGSDLAAALDLPCSPTAAFDLAVGTHLRRIDAIGVSSDGRERVAINVAAAGLAGRVDEVLARTSKPGRAKRYLPATLEALVSYRAMKAALCIDGQSQPPGRYYLIAIANGPTFGRGMRVAPRALIDDGLLDFVMVGDVPRWQLPYRLPQLLLGRHLDTRWVTFVRGETLELTGLEPDMPPIDLDGESVNSSRAAFRVLPGALGIAVG